MTVLEIVALLSIGGIAGFINVLSAGGSMLTLPLLMFLGLPPQVANGTNRVAITLQSITAVGSFYRMGHGNLVVSLHLAIPAVLGSLVGAWVATWVSDTVFEWVLVSAMIGASVFMLLPQPVLNTRPLTPERRLARLSTWRCLLLACTADSSRLVSVCFSLWCYTTCSRSTCAR